MSKIQENAWSIGAIVLSAVTIAAVGGQPLAAKAETAASSALSATAEPTQHLAPFRTQAPGTAVSVTQAQPDKTAAIPPIPGTVETSARSLQAVVPVPAPTSPTPEAPATEPSSTPNPLQKQRPKYKLSYLGIGINLGRGGDTSGLSETSFAAFSKFALSSSFSVRPALLVNKNTTVLLPFTYDFPISGPGQISPYIGLGLQSSSPFSAATTKSDLLLTAGIDYPINSHLAFTTGVNLGTFNRSGVGVLLGLAYSFNTAPGPESSTTSAPETGATPDQTPKSDAPAEKEHHLTENWNAHFQTTFIYQDKPAFNARYTGTNSLLSTAENFTYSLTSTGFFGVRLWPSGEFYLDPELNSAVPPSQLFGLGSLSNGEDQKSPSITPLLYLARAFLRQTWSLGGDKTFVESGQNQLAEDVDSRRLVLTLGKISVPDLFGPNRFSGSPRTQFFNYSFLTYNAWDYGANQRGYTVGAALEYFRDAWAFRFGRFAALTTSNGPTFNWDLLHQYSDQIEVEHAHVIGGQPGKVRLLGFHYRAKMAAFQDALNLWETGGRIGVPSINDVRREQDQFGFGIALEQSLGTDVGLFLIGSWNDARTENYSYTDVERAFTGGLSIQGTGWGRPQDTLGFGYGLNGIGAPFRKYLEAGGLGPFIGDGQLNYHPEQILEAYYNIGLAQSTTLGFDLQYIINPAYNADRGPVFFIGARLHVEF